MKNKNIKKLPLKAALTYLVNQMIAEKCITNQLETDIKDESYKNREKEFDDLVKRDKQKIKKNIEEIEREVVEELNKKHAVVHTDQFYILTEKPHPLFSGIDFSLESKQSFINTYENQIPEGHTLNKAKIWLKHTARRQYRGITFDPTAAELNNGLYNIWKGFAVKTIAGKSPNLFWNHVEHVICSGNKNYYLYLRKWLASLIQKPHELATAIVLMGKQGTGKNTFVDTIGKLFGMHYLPLDNIQQLLGQFNFHLKNAVLIHANEAIWGGNRKEFGVLKSMITDQFSFIEGKCKDGIVVRNFKHVIISSNEDWPVHLDRDDRRFLIMQVSDKHKEDKPYFRAIFEELVNGGLNGLLHDLQNEDISNFDPRQLPENPDAFEIKLTSASSTEKYIYAALQSGSFDISTSSSSNWKLKILTDSVYNDYSYWCEKQNIKKETKEALGKALKKTIPSIDKDRGSTESRPWFYTFPSLEKAREDFQKSYKADSSIWN